MGITRLLSLSGQFKRGRHYPLASHLSNQSLFRAFSTSAEQDFNRFHNGVTLNPHPDKRHKGGEDAATVNESFIALADGVGGWIESGVDPAKYSKQLCKNIHGLIMYDSAKYIVNPKQLCIDAAKMATEVGSSTCVIASLDRDTPVLYTSNLGDSGYLLLRKTDSELKTLYRSQEQTHGFNFPFQIGTSGDNPEKADSL